MALISKYLEIATKSKNMLVTAYFSRMYGVKWQVVKGKTCNRALLPDVHLPLR